MCVDLRLLVYWEVLDIVTFIGDYARHTSVYFIKTKDEVLEKIKTFYNFAENFTGKQVKVPLY